MPKQFWKSNSWTLNQIKILNAILESLPPYCWGLDTHLNFFFLNLYCQDISFFFIYIVKTVSLFLNLYCQNSFVNWSSLGINVTIEVCNLEINVCPEQFQVGANIKLWGHPLICIPYICSGKGSEIFHIFKNLVFIKITVYFIFHSQLLCIQVF